MNMGHLCHEYKRGCILKVTFLTTSLGGWSDLFICMSPVWDTYGVKALVSSSRTKPWLVKMPSLWWQGKVDVKNYLAVRLCIVAHNRCFRPTCSAPTSLKTKQAYLTIIQLVHVWLVEPVYKPLHRLKKHLCEVSIADIYNTLRKSSNSSRAYTVSRSYCCVMIWRVWARGCPFGATTCISQYTGPLV